jgi:hypothetical protein
MTRSCRKNFNSKWQDHGGRETLKPSDKKVWMISVDMKNNRDFCYWISAVSLCYYYFCVCFWYFGSYIYARPRTIKMCVWLSERLLIVWGRYGECVCLFEWVLGWVRVCECMRVCVCVCVCVCVRHGERWFHCFVFCFVCVLHSHDFASFA